MRRREPQVPSFGDAPVVAVRERPQPDGVAEVDVAEVHHDPGTAAVQRVVHRLT